MSAFWQQFLAEISTEHTPTVALTYYLATSLLGHILHLLVSRVVAPRSRNLANCVHDLVSAFLVSACSLENGTLLKLYGMPTFLAVLFSVIYWQSVTLPAGFSGNPCSNWRRYLADEISIGTAGIRMTCQMAGGQLAFWYARSYWSLGLTATHGLRLASSADCVSDLTVWGPYGFALEFISIFADSMLLAALTIFIRSDSWLMRSDVQLPIFSLMGTWLTYHGLYLTGMYANPANASAQTFGCRGTPIWLHALVYWAAPLLAATFGHRLESRLVSPRKSFASGSLDDKKKI